MVARRTAKMLAVTCGEVGLRFETGGDRNIDYAAIGVEQQLFRMHQAAKSRTDFRN